MQSGLLILIILAVSPAAYSAPAKGSATSAISLGDQVFQKQKYCEDIISETIDGVLDEEDTFPVADDDYHSCKEELDELKRKYMTTYNIKTPTDTELFPITLSDGSQKLVSLPAEEGAEIRDLEFDVTEELCVTIKKCETIKGLIEKQDTYKANYKERFYHCHLLLDIIKHKYIEEMSLDENKLKLEGGLKVTCDGKNNLMSLPSFMNNLDYHKTENGLFNYNANDEMDKAPMDSSANAGTRTDPHVQTPEEAEHGGHSGHDKTTSKDDTSKHGTPSSGSFVKANFFSYTFAVFVLVILIEW